MAFLIESKGMRRIKATVWTGTVVWLIGFATIFSMAGMTLEDILSPILGDIELEAEIYQMNMFQVIDFFTASIMLPLGGLFIAVFAGWVMDRHSTEQEFSFQNSYVYSAWHVMVRYVSPVLVFLVFVNITGIFKF